MRKKYNIKNIADYLDELGFKWLDHLMKDSVTEKYERATLSSFNKMVDLLVESKRTGRQSLISLSVDNETFVLRSGNTKSDMSEDWQSFLSETQKATV